MQVLSIFKWNRWKGSIVASWNVSIEKRMFIKVIQVPMKGKGLDRTCFELKKKMSSFQCRKELRMENMSKNKWFTLQKHFLLSEISAGGFDLGGIWIHEKDLFRRLVSCATMTWAPAVPFPIKLEVPKHCKILKTLTSLKSLLLPPLWLEERAGITLRTLSYFKTGKVAFHSQSNDNM